MNRKRVGILAFLDVEVLDFAGPFEVFSVTRLNEDRRREELSPFEVLTVAPTLEPVRATGGLRILPDYDLLTCPKLDVLVIPGGWGTRTEVNNPILTEWIQTRAEEVELLASVCTGSFLLGKAGVLAGKRATTHWRSLDRMAETFPDVQVQREQHVVWDGTLVTSAGISAGIDMALEVVAHFHGREIAEATAKQMEYPYPVDNHRRVNVNE